MKIGIHHREGSYSDRWIEYCQEHQIAYKIVNAYDTDVIEQLRDCDIFMWHHHQANYKDALFAKQLLFSLEQVGKVVFPDWRTGWHFDDKVGQKYLFEAHNIKLAPAYVFYSKKEAYEWIEKTIFPKVFKLRGGASSSNVMLAKNKREAKYLVNKSFSRGWKYFSGVRYFIGRLKSFKNGKMSLFKVIKGFGRIFIEPSMTKMMPKQKGYVYFQEFIPNEGFDYRIEICGDKCTAWVRYVRKNDFRASGGHDNHAEKELIPQDVLRFAFDITDKLKLQAAALDIVRHKETGELFLIENSYCYGADDDEFEHGYWDKDGVFHDEKFNGFDWMIENVIHQYLKVRGIVE